MNLLRHPQPRRDEVHIVSRSRNPLLGFLLKRMEYVDRLQRAASLETLERLGIRVLVAPLRLEDREPYGLPDWFRELLEVVEGGGDPHHILRRARFHDWIIPLLE